MFEIFLWLKTSEVFGAYYIQKRHHYQALEDILYVRVAYTKDSKRLQGFLGFTSYYRKIIKNYMKISISLSILLNILLKKDSFQWNNVVESAFQVGKQAMVTTTLLAHLDFLFVIKCDTLGIRIDAILMQVG